ncbi:Hypothetical protein PHPALM_18454 [Phytophthora palmivora]|uniref:Uncharacterized protein n=1 Tax=Phytophthora palmivora TaxID=4796 RepID=A0A2P4XJS1_9STRA|nr:Hypothetical protein PHPALM_18454 [Phytophthora palmivora]
MLYYRQAKIWLLDQFPRHWAALEARLLKMEKPLNSFCMKRGLCSKADLKKCFCSCDNQDVALLCLLLYLFGKASVFALFHKPNISIDPIKILFLRFIRLLFPGTEFETCKMLAMPLAVLM